MAHVKIQGERDAKDGSFFPRGPDPDGLFSSVLREGQGNNPMVYSNPQIEELFDQAKAITDRAERTRLYEQLLKTTMLDDTPVVKIQTMEIVWAANNNVQDFNLHPKGYPNWFEWTWAGE